MFPHCCPPPKAQAQPRGTACRPSSASESPRRGIQNHSKKGDDPAIVRRLDDAFVTGVDESPRGQRRSGGDGPHVALSLDHLKAFPALRVLHPTVPSRDPLVSVGRRGRHGPLEASLAIEGKFSEDGLLTLTQGEDMATALAKTLVDGLETEGVEQVWSRLNRGNAPGQAAEAPLDGWLFYVDPHTFVRERKTRVRREKKPSDVTQLELFEGL